MSFSQEVKDFLAGWQAVDSMAQKRADRKLQRDKFDADQAYNQAMLEIKKQELALRKAGGGRGGGGGGPAGPKPMTEYQTKTLSLREQELALKKAEAEARAKAEAAASAEERAAADAEAAVSGVDDQSFNIDDYYTDDSEDSGAIPEYARGGLVVKAETGGMIEDPTKKAPGTATFTASPKEEKPAVSAPQALPVASAPAPAQTPAPAQPEPSTPDPTRIVVAKAGEAAAAAMRSFTVESKQPNAAVGSEKSGMDIVSNTGGMTLDEYEAVLDKVDPNNEMPSHMRSTAALGAAYDYFMGKGQTDKAVKAARGFLIANKNATQALGALTLQALEDGHINDACRLFNDACNRFPSGHEIIVNPDPRKGLVYTVKNEGKVVEQGALDVQRMYELSGKIADGSLYVDQMARFAAQHDTKKPKQSFGVALEGVTEAYGTLAAANEAYGALGTDASYEEKKAAHDAVVAANKEFEGARKAALDLGLDNFSGKGDRDAYEVKVKKAIDQAMKLPDPAVAVPEAPEPPGPGLIERIGGAIKDTYAPQPKGPAVTPQGNNQPTGGIPRPKPGDIMDGYRFKGGDPAQPSSWEEVR